MDVAVRYRMVGRAQELGVFEECVRRVAAGEGQVVVLEGEAGIGKTRLLQEVAEGAGQAGVTVLWGAGQELERTRPFGAVADALGLTPSPDDPERARIRRLLVGDRGEHVGDELLDGEGPGVRYLVLEAVVELVERLALRAPVLLVLEDLQWADPSSLSTVGALGRRLRQVPLALVTSLRPPPRAGESSLLVSGLLERGALPLRLEGLDEEAVDALVVEVEGATAGPGLRDQLRGARGNPLFVIELLHALRQEGALQLGAGSVETRRSGLPPSLRGVMTRRLSGLPEATVQVLRVASVLGATFAVARLGLVTGRSAVELMPVLEPALRAGMLEVAGARLRFRHELLREAIYSDLPEARRTGLHREVAHALASAGAPAALVGEHFALGALPGDQEAVGWLRHAARDAAPRAPGVAAELLERALAVAGPAAPSHDELTADLVTAQLWLGRPRDAERLVRATLPGCRDASTAARLRLDLLQALLGQGRIREACRESERALGQLDLPRGMRGRLQAEAAWGWLLSGDAQKASALAEVATHGDEQPGADDAGRDDDAGRRKALAALARLEASQGRPGKAVALATDAIVPAARGRDHPHVGLTLTFALLEADQFDAAERALHDGRQLAEASGTELSLALYQRELVELRFFEDRWDDALAEAETVIALADEFNVRIGLVGVHTMQAMIATHRNDLAGAERALACAEAELARSGSGPYWSWPGWARGLLAEAQGRGELAVVALEHAWDEATRTGSPHMYLRFGPDLVRLHLAAGDARRAGAISEQVREVAARQGTASARCVALRCQGLASGDAQALREAATTAADSPRPRLRAAACEEAGMALIPTTPSEAVRLLEQARASYDQVSARRDSARVDAALRSLGIRHRSATRRKRRASRWDSLTPAEREVVDLLVQGLTNQEAARQLFISHRTVETHVAHVFAKLGVSSRAALTTEAHRHTTLAGS